MPEKEYFYITWLLDERPVGHTNINHIHYGESASMHLHLWEKGHRQSGLGFTFIQQSIPLYFEHFKLQKLICEPFADNIAPNKTMKKLGFEFIRSYETIPGPINIFQRVNRYELSRNKLTTL